MIVMYHRLQDNPISCPPKIFEKQIKMLKKSGAKLTFDDALKDHYTIAFPILKKYGLKATFYPHSCIGEKMARTHKVWQLNAMGYDKSFLIANPDYTDDLYKLFFDEQEEIKKIYMSWDEIKELHENGMEIGCHTHTHPFMTHLSKREQKWEIKTSMDILTKKIERPISYAHPYGMYNQDTLDLLKEFDFDYAVTTKSEPFLELHRIDTNEF